MTFLAACVATGVGDAAAVCYSGVQSVRGGRLTPIEDRYPALPTTLLEAEGGVHASGRAAGATSLR